MEHLSAKLSFMIFLKLYSSKEAMENISWLCIQNTKIGMQFPSFRFEGPRETLHNLTIKPQLEKKYKTAKKAQPQRKVFLFSHHNKKEWCIIATRIKKN